MSDESDARVVPEDDGETAESLVQHFISLTKEQTAVDPETNELTQRSSEYEHAFSLGLVWQMTNYEEHHPDDTRNGEARRIVEEETGGAGRPRKSKDKQTRISDSYHSAEAADRGGLRHASFSEFGNGSGGLGTYEGDSGQSSIFMNEHLLLTNSSAAQMGFSGPMVGSDTRSGYHPSATNAQAVLPLLRGAPMGPPQLSPLHRDSPSTTTSSATPAMSKTIVKLRKQYYNAMSSPDPSTAYDFMQRLRDLDEEAAQEARREITRRMQRTQNALVNNWDGGLGSRRSSLVETPQRGGSTSGRARTIRNTSATTRNSVTPQGSTKRDASHSPEASKPEVKGRKVSETDKHRRRSAKDLAERDGFHGREIRSSAADQWRSLRSDKMLEYGKEEFVKASVRGIKLTGSAYKTFEYGCGFKGCGRSDRAAVDFQSHMRNQHFWVGLKEKTIDETTRETVKKRHSFVLTSIDLEKEIWRGLNWIGGNIRVTGPLVRVPYYGKKFADEVDSDEQAADDAKSKKVAWKGQRLGNWEDCDEVAEAERGEGCLRRGYPDEFYEGHPEPGDDGISSNDGYNPKPRKKRASKGGREGGQKGGQSGGQKVITDDQKQSPASMAHAEIQAGQAQESGELDEDEEEAPVPVEFSFSEADASALGEHDADAAQD